MNQLFPNLNSAMGDYFQQAAQKRLAMTPQQRDVADREQFNKQQQNAEQFTIASDPNKSKSIDPFKRQQMANAQNQDNNQAMLEILGNMDKYGGGNNAKASVTYTNPGTSSVNNPGVFRTGGSFQTSATSLYPAKIRNRSMI